MKVGDLVRIAPHCVNKGRLALVVCANEGWDAVRIVYVDNGPQPNAKHGKGHAALVRNLEVISESR